MGYARCAKRSLPVQPVSLNHYISACAELNPHILCRRSFFRSPPPAKYVNNFTQLLTELTHVVRCSSNTDLLFAGGIRKQRSTVSVLTYSNPLKTSDSLVLTTSLFKNAREEKLNFYLFEPVLESRIVTGCKTF